MFGLRSGFLFLYVCVLSIICWGLVCFIGGVMKRKVLFVLVLVVLVGCVVSVVAWKSNWFKLFETKGTVSGTETSIQAVTIDFGTLLPATDFEKTSVAQIYVDEAGGVKITNIILVIKYNVYGESSDYAEQHLESCFYDLCVNISVSGETIHLIIVTQGNFYDYSTAGYDKPYWDWEECIYPDSQTKYPVYTWYGWNDNITIPQGSHEISITVYGKAGTPSATQSFVIEFYLELNPVA